MRAKDTWIVVGSSPSVSQHFDAVMDAHPDATTFACNSALKLFTERRPDYFIAVDETAGIVLNDLIWGAVRNGTKFVTYENSLLKRNLEGKISLPGFEVKTPQPDILLVVGRSVRKAYQPGNIVFAQYSGLAAMQFALKQGAERLVIVGCDGYEGDHPGVDFPIVTFDGHGGDSWGAQQTREVIEPFMRSMVKWCPHVKFIQYGEPRFTVDEPNYETASLGVQI